MTILDDSTSRGLNMIVEAQKNEEAVDSSKLVDIASVIILGLEMLHRDMLEPARFHALLYNSLNCAYYLGQTARDIAAGDRLLKEIEDK